MDEQGVSFAVVLLGSATVLLFVLAEIRILRCEVVLVPMAVIACARVVIRELSASTVWTWIIISAIPIFSIALYYLVDACALRFARILHALGHDAPDALRRFRWGMKINSPARTAR